MSRLLILLTVILLLANLVFLDWKFLQPSGESESSKVRELESKITVLEARLDNLSLPATATVSAVPNACPQTCVDLISANKSVPKTTIAAPATKLTVNNKAEYYVPLGTGTVLSNGSWVTIDSAQATFNPDDYPKNSAIYFEVVMHTAGSGEVQARLYDTSTPNIFAGEVLKTQSTTGELLSVQMKYLLHGSKTYKVQMNTSIASAVLDSARLRVVAQ